MRKRSYVNYLANLYTCAVYGTDGSLTAVTRPFDIGLHLAESEIKSCLGAILRRSLGCIRSIFLRATETHLACRRPRDNLTL